MTFTHLEILTTNDPHALKILTTNDPHALKILMTNDSHSLKHLGFESYSSDLKQYPSE